MRLDPPPPRRQSRRWRRSSAWAARDRARHRAHRQRQHDARDPRRVDRAWPRSARLHADALRRRGRAARRGDRARARHPQHPGAGGAGHPLRRGRGGRGAGGELRRDLPRAARRRPGTRRGRLRPADRSRAAMARARAPGRRGRAAGHRRRHALRRPELRAGDPGAAGRGAAARFLAEAGIPGGASAQVRPPRSRGRRRGHQRAPERAQGALGLEARHRRIRPVRLGPGIGRHAAGLVRRRTSRRIRPSSSAARWHREPCSRARWSSRSSMPPRWCRRAAASRLARAAAC